MTVVKSFLNLLDSSTLFTILSSTTPHSILYIFIVLAEKPFEEMKGKAEKKAKLYYMSCIDVNETVDAKGSEPMLKLLKETGGWSISGDFEIKSWKLQTKLQTLQNR